jgi:hypothetical protein
MLKHEAHIIARMSLIDEMTPAVGNMNKKLKGTAKQASAVKQQMRFMRGGMGQVGHQIQDIAVQLQMGQNKMLVFGQQGSQIASLFGPHGALIGAFLAVGAALATSFMPSFFGASKALKSVKDESKSLINNFDNLDGALKSIAIAQAKKEIDELTQEMERQEKKIEKLTSRNENLTGQMKRNKKTQQELDEVTQEHKDNIVLLNAAKDKLIKKTDNSSDAFEKQAEAFNKEAATLGMSASALALYEISLMKIPPAQKIILANLKLLNIDRQEEIDLAKKRADELIASTAAEEKADKTRLASLRRTVLSKEGLLKADYDSNKALVERQVKDKIERDKLLLQLEEKYIADAKKLTDSGKKVSDELKEFRDTYRPIFNEFGDGFVDAITGAEKFSDAIRDMARNVIDSLLRIAVQKLIVDSLFSKFEGAFFSPSSGTSGSGVSSGGSAGTTSTLGGPVQTGRSVLVGERGPEVFTPNSPGQITPNHEIGGGGGSTIVQNINVDAGVSSTVRAEMMNLLPYIIKAAQNGVVGSKLRGGQYAKALA